MRITYSGTLEDCHGLPFHILENEQTIVFEEDIVKLICEGDAHLYQEQFLSSLSFQLFHELLEGKSYFPLQAYANQCVHIYSWYVQSLNKRKEPIPENLVRISERVRPMVVALGKIGQNMDFHKWNYKDSPSVIFEQELRKKMK